MDSDSLGRIVNLVMFGIFALVLLFAFGAGALMERAHLKRLAAREAAVAGVPVNNLRTLPEGAVAGEIVIADVVLSVDYFRSWISNLKKIIGGRLGAYERLLDRARREGTLRVIEAARAKGYDGVCNIRYDTSDIGVSQKKKQVVAQGAILVWGTAYRLKGRGS